MQETKFDVWSPVDSKNMLSRLFWIIGTLVSIVLLIVSLCIENAILALLDVLLPMGIILYGFIKRKKFPIYYYTTCLSGLYPIIWLIIINTCDFSKENSDDNSPIIVYAIAIVVFAAVVLALFSLCTLPSKASINQTVVNKISVNFKIDKIILLLSLLAILGSIVLNLNVICDKPYKTEWVYLQDIVYSRRNADVFYTKQGSDIQYRIDAEHNRKLVYTYDWRQNWLYLDENGQEVFEIEYGNGALGIPWRRIVGNK